MEDAMKSDLKVEGDAREFRLAAEPSIQSDIRISPVWDKGQMKLRHLRYFVAVAEELNFTHAAERLGINQPPLSLQIRQLKKELDTQLFRRRPQGVELTDAGKLMLEEARVILAQVETAKTDVRRRARGET